MKSADVNCPLLVFKTFKSKKSSKTKPKLQKNKKKLKVTRQHLRKYLFENKVEVKVYLGRLKAANLNDQKKCVFGGIKIKAVNCAMSIIQLHLASTFSEPRRVIGQEIKVTFSR